MTMSLIQFWSDLSPWAWFGIKLAQVGGFVLILSVLLAFLILMDRKVWAAVQMRRGPNVVGPGVYGIIIGGWASNSKYPFMGALRSAAQMISYEVSIGFIILTVIFLSGSMNLSAIVDTQAGGLFNWNMFRLNPMGEYGIWNLLLFPIMFYMGVMFFISALAETNRPPFDLPEAESELVAGFMVEYSSTPYLLFMFGEYLNMTLMCAMFTILFLGGWHAPIDIGVQFVPPVFWFFLKCLFMFFMFAMVKAIVPRYRYDQLMRLGWKVFLPTSLAAVVIVSTFVVFLGGSA